MRLFPVGHVAFKVIDLMLTISCHPQIHKAPCRPFWTDLGFILRLSWTPPPKAPNCHFRQGAWISTLEMVSAAPPCKSGSRGSPCSRASEQKPKAEPSFQLRKGWAARRHTSLTVFLKREFPETEGSSMAKWLGVCPMDMVLGIAMPTRLDECPNFPKHVGVPSMQSHPPSRLKGNHQPVSDVDPQNWSKCRSSLRLSWKLPEGLCKWNQVFQRGAGSFHGIASGEGKLTPVQLQTSPNLKKPPQGNCQEQFLLPCAALQGMPKSASYFDHHASTDVFPLIVSLGFWLRHAPCDRHDRQHGAPRFLSAAAGHRRRDKRDVA